MLDYPDVDAPTRERFLGVIRDEVARDERAHRATLAQPRAEDLKTRWPLEDMLGADLVAAALRRIEAQLGVPRRGRRGRRELWLQVDSFSLLQALVYLAGRLVDEYGVRLITLRLGARGRARPARPGLVAARR